MQILYVMGTGSKHDDIELKWSLRSVAKYAKTLPEIVISGHCPDFIDKDKVTWIPPVETHSKRKHNNMCDKVVHAIETGVCSKPFLLSSDDHFFVRSVDFDSYPRYLRPGIFIKDSSLDRENWSSYERSIQETRSCLLKCGLPIFHFCGHYNTWIDPRAVTRVKQIRERFPRTVSSGYEPTLLFANVCKYYRPQWPVTIRRDLKLYEWTSPNSVRESIGDRDSFSISDAMFDSESQFETMMNSWYDRPSPFEK